MIKKVLIANRGEIACRIIRSCRLSGIETIAVYSVADKDSPHVLQADYAVCIGPSPSQKSYMDAHAILSAAEITGADAVHPGYGFLAENPLFAKQCQEAGLIWIGPTPEIMAQMGDKMAAKKLAHDHGLATVPGSKATIQSHAEALSLVETIGTPILIKSVAGGGGRGMRIIEKVSDLEEMFNQAKLEALRTTNNHELYIERYLDNPKHIELQVLADQHGNVVILGERDCSVQRRYQKIIEEAPCLNLPRDKMQSLHEQVIQLCQAIGYSSAGTFEFLWDGDTFYFIEMNPRLQVEHPVTECTTGIDIVSAQLAIAQNQPLDLPTIGSQGHAIECRLLAEDPNTQIACPGKIDQLIWPGGLGIRIEAGVYAGFTVPHHYDPMIAKIISHGTDRAQAIARMQTALQELCVRGIQTNQHALLTILKSPWFNDASYGIASLQREQEQRVYAENSN